MHAAPSRILPSCPARPAAVDDNTEGPLCIDSHSLPAAMCAALQEMEDPESSIEASLDWVASLLVAAAGESASALVVRERQVYRQGDYVRTEAGYRARVESADGCVGYGRSEDKSEAARLCILDWRAKREELLRK